MRRIYILCLLGLFFFSEIQLYAYDFQSGGIYYNIIEGENNVEVTSGDTKYKGDIEIPVKISNNGKNYSVTSIGNSAFQDCSRLTSISIPNSVMSIGDNAFYRCSGLTSISISNSVTSIGDEAFSYCTGLTSISIPNSVTSIGDDAFHCCSGLTFISIPNSVTSIGNSAFYRCSGLTSISIPNSVTSIVDCTFEGCTGLTSINIPNSVTSIGLQAFWGCSGLTSISIPNSVTSIGNYAFGSCSGLKDIISEIRTPFEIDEYVFSDYSKPTLTVPSGTKSAYQSTAGWKKFTNIVEVSEDNPSTKRTIHVTTAGTLPDLISESEKYTIEELTLTGELNGTDFRLLRDMAGCNYKEEETDGKLTVLDFSGTKIVAGGDNYVDTYGGWGWWGGLHYTVNDNDMLPQYVFYGCKFTSLKIPNSVTSIGNYAFMDCTCLTSITIPSLVTSIGDMAFSGCSGLTSIVSEIVKPFVISEGVFSDYSTPTLTVPSGTKSAYQSTAGWNKFTNIVEASGDNTSTKRTIHVATAGTLPNLISKSDKFTIEELTLTGELNGTDFRLLRDMAGGGFSYSYDYGMFYDASNGKLTYLDISGAKIVSGGDAYIAYYDKGQDPKWNEDGEPRYYYLNSSDMIPECLFWNCKLTSVILPNSLVSIGYAAFMECNDLTSITIPNSVISIGNYAFNCCAGLTTITIPNSVTTIGFNAFCGCTSLTSITIPNSITTIGERAFGGCTSLTSITIPNSVTSIGERAFQNCSGLMSIKVEIGNNMYDSRNSCNAIIETSSNKLIMGCNNTIIPNTVKSIGNYAFYGCTDISSISIPNSVTTIGDCAFSGCSGLTTVTIPNSVTTIGDYAFNNCSGLTSITIPNSVTSIGNSAFSGCNALASVNSLIEAPFEISSSTFSTYDDVTLYVPKGTKQKYLATRFWYRFTKIDDGTEYNYDKEREVFVSIAGTLSNYISESEKFYIEKLTLKGELNGADFRLLREMAGNNDLGKETGGRLWYLDMSEARIVHGGGNYLNSRSISYEGGGIVDIGILHTSIEQDDEFADLIFAGCMSLKEVVLPQSVISIGYYSFWFCVNLESIVISQSVTSVKDEAFYGCKNLSSVISKIKDPFVINGVFSNDTYTNATLTVPYGTKEKYQSTAGWNKFTNIIEKEADNIIQGDANGDKEVNVSDIVEIVNYIMDNPSAKFVRTNADLNGDGEVNVTDIVMMVSIIMSGQTGSARTMSNRAGSMTDSDCLTIDDVNINAGETKSVSISLNNPDKKYTAFQFDLILPEGITIAKNCNGKLMASLDSERKDDHTLSVSELGKNTYRFLAFSMSNAELYGTNGSLVNITLEADANMDSGTIAAALKSQVFTATDGTQYKWSDLPFSIQVNKSENTGIDEISQNGQKGGMIKVYTLTGLLLFSVPQSEFSEKWQALPSGVYIVNGQKMIKTDDTK